MANSATGIEALVEPTFIRNFDTALRVKTSQLRAMCDVKRAAEGGTFFDVTPPQYTAGEYNIVNDQLTNLLGAVYRPRRPATQADVTAGLTKTVAGAQVPLVVGDIITDPSVPKNQTVQARRRKTETKIFGVTAKVSKLNLDQFKFEAAGPLMEQISTTIAYTIDYVIISALYGFGLGTDNEPLIPKLNEFYTNPDGSTVNNISTGFRDYNGVNPITGSNSRSLLSERLVSEEIGTFTLIDLFEARARILQGGKLNQNAILNAAIHPETFAKLYSHSSVLTPLSYTNSDAVLTGHIYQLAGIRIISTANCAKDVITVFSTNAIGFAVGDDSNAGAERKLEEANSLVLAGWINMGAAVLREEQIVHIIQRTA